jgi:HAD superfamily hydrolase (TIGR01509 family)
MAIKWIHQFQLFLFDFDGLLVNTEHLHFAAYTKMCAERGYKLEWDFEQFCTAAHFDSTGLRDAIYAAFPALYAQESRWEVLYAEKKRQYLDVLRSDELQLMPGAARLLSAIKDAKIKCCVATNSPKEQIEYIKERLPVLESIPIWFTREDYSKPKPDPEVYLKAIAQLAEKGDRIIGFEDSIRGLKALIGAQVPGVLIRPKHYPQAEKITPWRHFESLEEIPDQIE